MHKVLDTTYAHAAADGTNPKYVPGQYADGDYLMVWVRNTTNQNLLARLEHAVTDPADQSQRWAALASASGVAEATFAPAGSGDGLVVIFDGGPLASAFRIRLVAASAVTGTSTVSVQAWVG